MSDALLRCFRFLFARLNKSGGQAVRQAPTPNQFHAEERSTLVCAHFVNGNNVWMVQMCHGFGFRVKTF
jgi:hypothetical protein